jgi:hypothetical protein
LTSTRIFSSRAISARRCAACSESSRPLASSSAACSAPVGARFEVAGFAFERAGDLAQAFDLARQIFAPVGEMFTISGGLLGAAERIFQSQPLALQLRDAPLCARCVLRLSHQFALSARAARVRD